MKKPAASLKARGGQLDWSWKVKEGENTQLRDKLMQLRKRVAELEPIVTEDKWAEGELKQSFQEVRRSLEATLNAVASAVEFQEIRRSLEATVNTVASVAEMKDPHTAGHQRQVARLSCDIAKEMGLSDEKIEGIRVAAMVHDIGKINVPAEILSKSGTLDRIEFDLVKTHPQGGYDILKQIRFPWPVAEIVLQHHERMNGSGYPQGLKGDDILLEARVLAVADVVEAMSSHRPYRPALGIDRAIEEIKKNKSKLYDRDVVAACLRVCATKSKPNERVSQERTGRRRS